MSLYWHSHDGIDVTHSLDSLDWVSPDCMKRQFPRRVTPTTFRVCCESKGKMIRLEKRKVKKEREMHFIFGEKPEQCVPADVVFAASMQRASSAIAIVAALTDTMSLDLCWQLWLWAELSSRPVFFGWSQERLWWQGADHSSLIYTPPGNLETSTQKREKNEMEVIAQSQKTPHYFSPVQDKKKAVNKMKFMLFCMCASVLIKHKISMSKTLSTWKVLKGEVAGKMN